MNFQFINRINFFTPRASYELRILGAALIWTFIGFFLLIKGLFIFLSESSILTKLFIFALGLVIGLFKSRLIFDPAAKKIIKHIESKPQRACFGGLFSVRNWALILVMALFGKAIGALPMNAALKSAIYVMVGSGLCYSSRLLWQAWRESPPGTQQGN